jgi:NhaP-type Na+/H+ or K+/H+ antiporter
MPLVFVAVGAAAEGGTLTVHGALAGLGMIAAAGAVVGMVHGLVLVHLLKRAAPELS